ncbi:MAG: PIN domain-containing protein [Phormidesmis sp.]
MKVLYDTSILIPALLTEHEYHSRALPQLEQARQNDDVQGFISTHSMAEIYSVTTRLPKPLRLSPQAAQTLILDLEI